MLDKFLAGDPDQTSIYKKIASIISFHDENVGRDIDALFNDFELNASNYEERCVDLKTASKKQLMWIGIVDILIKHEYVIEFDHSVEWEDFCITSKELKGYQHFESLRPLSTFPFDDEKTLDEWCAEINTEYACNDALFVSFEIGSDSFPLFLTTLDFSQWLEKLAKKIDEEFIVFCE